LQSDVVRPRSGEGAGPSSFRGTMEEKHPIKFSLGQFIILLGVEVVVLALVFLLGARFGGALFPSFYAKQFSNPSQYFDLKPDRGGGFENARPLSNKLVDTLDPEDQGEDSEEDIPHFRVDANGVRRSADPEELEDSDHEFKEDHLSVNKNLWNNPLEKQTMVRFKSSGSNAYAVQVGEYFDELIAAKKIDSLKKKGYEAYLVIQNPSRRSPTFTVRVGIFGERGLAEEFATRMSNKQGIELRVVSAN